MTLHLDLSSAKSRSFVRQPAPAHWFGEWLGEVGTGGFRSWALVGFMGETLFSHEPPGPEQKLCQWFAMPCALDLSFKNNCLDTER
ncbi:hypothetical protein QL104_31090 [Pseudomonas piscis]|uniref:Uncharacterized protein n=1 Tax=Pseudomonas piscis TaxID=2614538 RepID=A0ABY9NGQ7_9PSED|nr:hypothetical protein [Pseudomonas piscis]WMN17739.1 hypothetical protein QL104_31090 [Pseudomonas piscis]